MIYKTDKNPSRNSSVRKRPISGVQELDTIIRDDLFVEE